MATMALTWMVISSGGWADTFARDAVGSHVPPGVTRAVVVAAGETDARKAAGALIQALRQSKTLKVAMTQNALGRVAHLDDPTIARKAKALPVDAVFIVRVFPGADGADAVVVTVYEPGGETLGAFSGTEGVALPSKRREAVSEGLSRSVADAVTKTTPQPDSDAEEKYEQRKVWFTDMAAVNQFGGVVATWSTPYQGKYKKPLKGAKFYELVGRPDLAKQYRSAETLRWTVFGLGVAGAIGGTALMLTGLSGGDYCSTSDYNTDADRLACQARSDAASDAASTRLTWGLILSGVGYIAAIVPLYLNSHPVDASEARRLADVYNKKLKQKLGLASAAPTPTLAPTTSAVAFDVSPWVARDGGGMQLALRF